MRTKRESVQPKAVKKRKVVERLGPAGAHQLNQAERREQPPDDHERDWTARAEEREAPARPSGHRNESEADVPHPGSHRIEA